MPLPAVLQDRTISMPDRAVTLTGQAISISLYKSPVIDWF